MCFSKKIIFLIKKEENGKNNISSSSSKSEKEDNIALLLFFSLFKTSNNTLENPSLFFINFFAISSLRLKDKKVLEYTKTLGWKLFEFPFLIPQLFSFHYLK